MSYEYSPNIWGSSGEVQQANLANQCVKNSRTTIILINNNIVYIFIKKLKNPLIRDEIMDNKILRLDDCFTISTGYPPDIYYLNNKLKDLHLQISSEYSDVITAYAVSSFLKNEIYNNARGTGRLLGCVINILDHKTTSKGFFYNIDVEGVETKTVADVRGELSGIINNNLLTYYKPEVDFKNFIEEKMLLGTDQTADEYLAYTIKNDELILININDILK